MIDCRYCGEHIRDDPEAVGARCPRCREPLHERGGGPRLADEPGVNPDAATCAVHVGNLALANRIVIAPMCQYSAIDGCMTDWHLIHLGHLSLSGAALLPVSL